MKPTNCKNLADKIRTAIIAASLVSILPVADGMAGPGEAMTRMTQAPDELPASMLIPSAPPQVDLTRSESTVETVETETAPPVVPAAVPPRMMPRPASYQPNAALPPPSSMAMGENTIGAMLHGGREDAQVVPVQHMTTSEMLCTECEPPVAMTAGQRTSPKGRLISGVGFYYFRPQWSQNTAYTTVTSNAVTPGNTAPVTGATTAFDYDFGGAPRFWLGYILPEGVGGRMRYFRFDQGTSQNVTSDDGLFVISNNPLGAQIQSGATGAGPVGMNFGSGLDLYAIDMEVIKDLQIGRMEVIYFGGLRYAHLIQDYSATESIAGGQFTQSASNQNAFGATAGIDDVYKVGDTGIGLYGSFRGSLLFGKTRQTVQANIANAGPVSATSDYNAVVPVGEMEVGVSYARDIGPMNLELKVGFAGQIWWDVGNSAQSNMSTNTLSSYLPSSGERESLGLYGLTVTTGLRY